MMIFRMVLESSATRTLAVMGSPREHNAESAWVTSGKTRLRRRGVKYGDGECDVSTWWGSWAPAGDAEGVENALAEGAILDRRAGKSPNQHVYGPNHGLYLQRKRE